MRPYLQPDQINELQQAIIDLEKKVFDATSCPYYRKLSKEKSQKICLDICVHLREARKILATAYPWADAAMANLSECPTSVDGLASSIASSAYFNFTHHQLATKKEKRDVREYMESLEGLEEYVDLAYATWVAGTYPKD